ncbi:Uncharacterised protein [Streptococcus pneumoniae]|nr:Uncharacterised protein [Streptococcus pneumoniae]
MSGRTFGTEVPLIVTLFSINVVPAGIVSITEVLIVGIVESLNTSNVNVITSPITTIDLSAVFSMLIIGSINVVVTVFVCFVIVIGGSSGSMITV